MITVKTQKIVHITLTEHEAGVLRTIAQRIVGDVNGDRAMFDHIDGALANLGIECAGNVQAGSIYLLP